MPLFHFDKYQKVTGTFSSFSLSSDGFIAPKRHFMVRYFRSEFTVIDLQFSLFPLSRPPGKVTRVNWSSQRVGRSHFIVANILLSGGHPANFALRATEMLQTKLLFRSLKSL